MDKRTLSPEELERLKTFVISRSQRFAEPVVLLEITDHFACKTEELLSEEPSLSFEAALKKAHHAFGAKGFAPIAETCEKRLYAKYKRAHQEAQRKILFSPHGLGLLAIGLLVSQLSYWLRYRGLSLFNGFGGTFLLELLFVSGVFLIWSRKKATKKKHPLVFEKAYEAGHRIFGWLWIGVIFIPVSTNFIYLSPVFNGCLAFLLSLQLMAFYHLRRKVNIDIAGIEQRLQLTTSV